MSFECFLVDDIEYRLNADKSIYLRFDDKIGYFIVTARDGKRLLTDVIEVELKRRKWEYYEDGHCGLYAWIVARKHDQSELEAILMSRQIQNLNST